MMSIRGLLFDFGGTIDTDGVHWYNLFRDTYYKEIGQLPDESFKSVYVTTERKLGKEQIIKSDFSLLQTLQKKIEIQSDLLSNMGITVSQSSQNAILHACYDYVSSNIRDTSRPILNTLSKSYPLVLISNFYGNMHTVLKEFELDSQFADVIESSVVNIRKPDPEIFRLGVSSVNGALPSEIVMVGDSLDKDIIPATSIGCKTVWLHNMPWEGKSELSFTPTHTISHFSDLLNIF